jgi:segregation and condensation protein B
MVQANACLIGSWKILPPDLRWREWMLRVEAVIFASAEPVTRETLARVVGKDCSIDLLIDDLHEDLRSRPYELVSVAGGWQHRSRTAYAEQSGHQSGNDAIGAAALSEFEAMVLMAIAYFQPVTRSELSKIFGKEVSRDVIGSLRGAGFIASGPRSPTPGAPYTFVTTPSTSCRRLGSGDADAIYRTWRRLRDAGLLSRAAMGPVYAAVAKAISRHVFMVAFRSLRCSAALFRSR